MADIGSYLDLPETLLIDSVVLTVCIALLLRYARLSHSHPGTIYLFFHIYTFTGRLIGILFGASTLFSQYLFSLFEPVTHTEIVRAAILADVALAVMTVAWIRASVADKKRDNRFQSAGKGSRNLRLRHVWTVVSIAFPIGIIGILAIAYLPGSEFSYDDPSVFLGEWQSSTWVSMIMTWTGLGIIALIYWYGFRLWLVAPMILYLLLMSFQGYHRFRVIIPVLLLIQIYLDRRMRKWPPVHIAALLVLMILIFYPLKTIGRMAQEGATPIEIVGSSSEIIKPALSGEAADQQFLDQFASALTLIDENGKFYYGTIYLNLLTLPIPRPWWPDKPGLADYLDDVSRPWRPMDEMGMIVTFLGESYANFGFLGIVIVPYLLAYWLARAYFRAYKNNYFSVARFAYLLIACNLIQVYRDGLISIVVFTWVNMMPLVAIVALHYVLPKKVAKQEPPIVSTVPVRN